MSAFGSLEYARIYEQATGYSARLFVLAAEEARLTYPFFIRPLRGLPFTAAGKAEWGDLLSPEYTGPVVQQPGIAPEEFRARFRACCVREKWIAEFAHLHPWQSCAACLDPADVALDREIVYVDLTQPEERLWEASLSRTCRKNIHRTQHEKVRIFAATSLEHIGEFHRIYTQTMDRNHALERYYFPLTFFAAFFEQMPHNARFVLAEHAGQIIAATLYLHDATDVYAYLGGADHAFQQVRPTNGLTWETIRWAQEQGKKRLILGGGYKPDDGIFRFKSGFSPLRASFQVYRHVHQPEANRVMCAAWEEFHGRTLAGGYFPAYRTVPEP